MAANSYKPSLTPRPVTPYTHPSGKPSSLKGVSALKTWVAKLKPKAK